MIQVGTAARYEPNHTPELVEKERARVTEAGFDMIESDSRTLLLDIDEPYTDTMDMERSLRISTIEEILKIQVSEIERWRSKSGNMHIKLSVTGRELEPAERLLLELYLGSDSRRALHGLGRKWHNCSHNVCSVLYKPKRQQTTEVATDIDDLPF